MRPHAFTFRVTVTIAATLAVCSLAAARPDTRTPPQKSVDSLFNTGRYDTLRVLLPALIRDAETRGDSAALGWLTFQRGRVEITLGHQAAANGLFDRSIRLCEAARDTVNLLPALHFKAFVLRDSGHPDDAMKLFEREFDLANRAHILSGQAAGIGNLAYKDLRRGNLEAARIGFARSMQLNRKAGNTYNVVAGMLSMGMLQRALGNVDSTRYWYNEALRVCREHHYPMNELWSLNNLGSLEGDLGNQEAAAENYAAALKIGRRLGFDRGQALPLMNLATSLSSLGEFDRAREALDEAIKVCERAGFNDLTESNINALAELYYETGQYRQSAQTCRRILGEPDVFMAVERNRAAYGLALSLAELDSVDLAESELAPFVAPKVNAPDHMLQPYIEVTYADLLRRQERWKEALARATAVRDEADHAQRTDIGVSARLIESSCRRMLGDGPGALSALHAAMDSLEIARVESGETEGREAYGQQMMGDVIEGCRVLLEYPKDSPRADRVHLFYDALQRFKTRALLDRIHDPRGDKAVPLEQSRGEAITLDRLRSKVLVQGELLLDMFVGANQTFLFAVTPDSCRLVVLPGSHSGLADQIKLYGDVISNGAEDTRNAYTPVRIAAMQRALGGAVIHPVADLVAKATRVFVAPDGYYAAIPIGTVTNGDDNHMLMESRDVVEVPSASVLDWARRPTARSAARATMVAVADASESKHSFQEVKTLQKRFYSVQRLDAAPGVLDSLSRRADSNCIVHIAAHARVNDDSPWQSGFVMQAGEHDVAGATRGAMTPTPSLRAWEIARAKLPFAMAVLAGCETAGGRATSGEGVLGLTSAFLSAGVPVVVSSRWAVDDRVTAVLMSNFYDHLARGENVGSALRAAQLAVRSNRGTSHPFYWAGFSVVGDGTRVIAPARRARIDVRGIVYTLFSVLMVAWGTVLYRRRVALKAT